MFWARFWTRLPRNRRQERKGFDHQFCQRPFPQKRERPFFYFHISTTNRHESYQFPETIGTNLGRAGSPLPAARPDNDCGAHGVTRPTNVPIIIGERYHTNYFWLEWCAVIPRLARSQCDVGPCQNTDLIMEFTPVMRSSTCSFVGSPFLWYEHRLRKSPSR